MILYDTANWPQVTIHFRSSDWNYEEYASFMLAFKELLSRAKQENTLIKLFIQGSVENNLPPLAYYTWVIDDVRKLYPTFQEVLLRTSIFTPTNDLDIFFDMLFAVYKPAKPFKRFSDYDAALKWLHDE